MPFCPLSPTLPASKSANKSPRICYACSLSPSCRADARGVLLRGKLGRAHARFLTAKSLKKPRPPRRGKNLLSGICLLGCHAPIPGGILLLSTSQRLIQIGDQVVGVFQADGEAQQVLRGARRGTLDAGAVLDEAVRAAQAGGAYEELALRGHAERGCARSLHLEGEHAAEHR